VALLGAIEGLGWAMAWRFPSRPNFSPRHEVISTSVDVQYWNLELLLVHAAWLISNRCTTNPHTNATHYVRQFGMINESLKIEYIRGLSWCLGQNGIA